MRSEVIGWITTTVGAPLVIVILCWTLVIYHYHRRQWRSVDLLVVALLIQGVIKQLATFLYTILTLLQPLKYEQEWCSSITWLLTSIHILQAGTLTTLIVSRLLAVKFPLKYRQAAKKTHLIYHLVSLSILSACIGIASVLAEGKPSHLILSSRGEKSNASVDFNERLSSYCSFLPHELDARYAIFSITIHSLLDITATFALVFTVFSWCFSNNKNGCKSNASESQPSTIVGNHGNQRQLLLTSSSDISAMSDLSLSSSAQNGGSSGKQTGRLLSNQRKCRNGERFEGLFLHGFVDGNCGKFMNGLKSPDGFDISGNVFNNAISKSSTENSFQQNASVFHPLFNSQSPNNFLNGTTGDKSSDIYKSSSAIFNNSGPKSLTTNGSNYDGTYDRSYGNKGNANGDDGCRWPSEPSYMSTSTSSTNSRAPCLAKQPIREEHSVIISSEDLKLGTAVAVLSLCYVVNHLPVLAVTVVGTFVPHLLPSSWPLAALYLWSGMIEECLLPVVVAMIDPKFTTWVGGVYTRQRSAVTELAKQQGLDGKFRVFNSQLHPLHPPTIQHQETAKFPITNGSLFTSVDGRLPIIHNYRRGKGVRTPGPGHPHCISMGLNSAHLRRNEPMQTFVSSTSPHHRPQFGGRSPSDDHDDGKQSFSPSSLDYTGPSSIDSIDNANNNGDVSSGGAKTLTEFRISDVTLRASKSVEDFDSELTGYTDGEEPIYATLSSQSCCSATTAANDDFEFYQHETNDFPHTKAISSRDLNAKSVDDRKPKIVGSTFHPNVDQDQRGYMQKYQPAEAEKLRSKRTTSRPEWKSEERLSIMDCDDKMLPLISSYDGNDESLFGSGLISTRESETARQIMKTVIENELRSKNKLLQSNSNNNNKDVIAIAPLPNGSTSHVSRSETNLSETRKPKASTVSSRERTNVRPTVEEFFPRQNGLIEKKNEKRRSLNGCSSSSSSFIKTASLSMNNLDDLCEEEAPQGDYTRRKDRKQRHASVQESKGANRKELPFELPSKSESVLSLYRLPEEVTTDQAVSEDGRDNGRRFSKQSSSGRRALVQPTPLARRLGQQTPPTKSRRHHRHKKMLPVLSVESLNSVLNQASVSYLDNGELCRHSRDRCGSVPDFKRVFVSDFI